MRDPQSLHRWVEDYNWDDGAAAMWPLVDDPGTEYATALLIYWRLGGPSWTSPGTTGVNREAWLLHQTVAERLLAGFYRRGKLRYHPIDQERLTRVHLYQLRKAGVPEDLLDPDYNLTDGQA